MAEDQKPLSPEQVKRLREDVIDYIDKSQPPKSSAEEKVKKSKAEKSILAPRRIPKATKAVPSAKTGPKPSVPAPARPNVIKLKPIKAPSLPLVVKQDAPKPLPPKVLSAQPDRSAAPKSSSARAPDKQGPAAPAARAKPAVKTVPAQAKPRVQPVRKAMPVGKWVKPLLVIIISASALLCVMYVLATYFFRWQGPAAEAAGSLIPLPAYTVGDRSISYAQYLRGVRTTRALRDYYPADSVWFIKDDAAELNLIRSYLVEQFLSREAAAISSRELAIEIQLLTKNISHDINAADFLAAARLTERELIDFYARPNILSRRLLKQYQGRNAAWQNARRQAELILEQLKNSEFTLEELSALNLNLENIKVLPSDFVALENIDQELRPVVSELNLGETSNVIDGQGSFRLIKLKDRLPEFNLFEYIEIMVEHGQDFKKTFLNEVQKIKIRTYLR